MANKKSSPTIESVSADFDKLELSDQVKCFQRIKAGMEDSVKGYNALISEAEEKIDILKQGLQIKD